MLSSVQTDLRRYGFEDLVYGFYRSDRNDGKLQTICNLQMYSAGSVGWPRDLAHPSSNVQRGSKSVKFGVIFDNVRLHAARVENEQDIWILKPTC